MTNEEALIILSVDTLAVSPDGALPVKLAVKHHNRSRTINRCYRLSKHDLLELKSLLFNTGGRCKDIEEFPIIEEILQLQYAISLLREYVLDFSVTDIVNLYKKNKTLLMPLVYLKNLIRRARRANKKVEAQSYSSLLSRLRGYCPEGVAMDVTGMDADWFEGFKTYLQDAGCSPEATSGYLELLRKVYTGTCRISGAKELFPSGGGAGPDFPEKAFAHFTSQADIERLLALKLKDEGLSAARNLLLLKHYAPGIAFADLMELKLEDVHEDGIWYRRRPDNRLCFVALSCGALVMIRERMDSAYNLLFRSPFEDMNDGRKRLDLKLEYYKEQLEKLVKIHP